MREVVAYVGRAAPMQGGEIAALYWLTEMSLDTIIARFDPGAPKAHFYKKAGGAILDVSCVDCGKIATATSRQAAVSILSDRAHRCVTCESAHREEKQRQQWRKREEAWARAEELRWMPYPEFLGTDEWAKNRRKALARAEFKCQICSSGGKLHVHHRTYARRGAERPADLTVLCADCHSIFHKHGRLAENGRAA